MPDINLTCQSLFICGDTVIDAKNVKIITDAIYVGVSAMIRFENEASL